MRDPYAPLQMPAARPAPAVRIEARRHLVLSLWLSAMMAVATLTVIVAKPASAAQDGVPVAKLSQTLAR